MASRHPHLPTNVPELFFSKTQILANLALVDTDVASRARVLALETGFRRRIEAHIATRVLSHAQLKQFNTSPFVLMIYSQAKGYTNISQLEGDILPAKLFSSMETSAGRMVEDVVLPIYGWDSVPSGMHTANSALDGKQVVGTSLRAVTLKSGPRCLNDEMSENFADNVLIHGSTWLAENNATQLDFTYGVLYGTKRQSNKKDWHILRNIASKLPQNQVISPPNNRWDTSFTFGGHAATATVRIGKDWWDYLGGPLCLTEVCTALIRACILPGQVEMPGTRYVISDLGDILRWPHNHPMVNVSLLQASQLPWLFFLMKHFCDILSD
jgi:hypothetical protein